MSVVSMVAIMNFILGIVFGFFVCHLFFVRKRNEHISDFLQEQKAVLEKLNQWIELQKHANYLQQVKLKQSNENL